MSSKYYKTGRPPIDVLKVSGQHEKFSPSKYKKSLRRTGLSPKLCDEIYGEICKKIRPHYTTNDLFRRSYRLIREHSPLAAVHYSLKRSLLELGPAGFNFENFMGKYLEALGYNVLLRQVLPGRCVNHEIDVVASSTNSHILMECKFHNRQGKKNDVKLPLYVKARRDDLNESKKNRSFTELWIASNTAFSEDAITYARCQNIKLLGINSPEKEPLLNQIRSMKLYPITTLKRLKIHTREKLIAKNVLLCSELVDNPHVLRAAGLGEHESQQLVKDVHSLLGVS